MLDRFKHFVASQHLVPEGGKVLLAVSGGRDSVCMAHLFHAVGIPFAVAHCNFRLRPGDCDRDQDFVRRLALRYGADFYTTAFDTKAFAATHSQSVEEAARTLRYRFFVQLCRDHGFRLVATAHHSDDSVETFFLNLFRGTGIAGLHGILPLTTLHASDTDSHPRVSLVRPMLCFSRRDIDSYVLEHGLEYVEDVTNSQLDARRNIIRHRLMPLLRELYPGVDATMLSNMRHLREVEQVFDHSVEQTVGMLERHGQSPFGFGYLYYDIPALLALQPRRPLVYALLRRFDFTSAAVDSIIAAMESGSTGARFRSPSSTALVDRDRLIVAGTIPAAAPQVAVEPVAPPCPPLSALRASHPAPHAPLSTSRPPLTAVEYIDAALVRQPLAVRSWQPGDRFCPLGMEHQRRVSDFLKDCKINFFEKQCVHVLVDADGRIVWVVGLRIDNRFRITESTRSVLRLSFKA